MGSIRTWALDAFAILAALPEVRRVGLALVEGGGRRLRFTASDRLDRPDLGWCDIDGYDDVPLNTATRTGAAVFGALRELEGPYPAFVKNQRGTSNVALAAVPVVDAGQVLGGYVLFFDQPQGFTHRQRMALTRLGRELGKELRRARRGKRRRTPPGRQPAVVEPGALVAVHEVAHHPAAVGKARHFLRATLQGWDVDDDAAETATLCLSELVTNAVIHSHGGCVVHVALADGVLRTSVRDSGASPVVAAGGSLDDLPVHGRGLQLVDALASRWGYGVDATGASAWFELKVG
jgi:anti-sigma regulatory factor (Ser/Thr protein kinase)